MKTPPSKIIGAGKIAVIAVSVLLVWTMLQTVLSRVDVDGISRDLAFLSIVPDSIPQPPAHDLCAKQRLIHDEVGGMINFDRMPAISNETLAAHQVTIRQQLQAAEALSQKIQRDVPNKAKEIGSVWRNAGIGRNFAVAPYFAAPSRVELALLKKTTYTRERLESLTKDVQSPVAKARQRASAEIVLLSCGRKFEMTRDTGNLIRQEVIKDDSMSVAYELHQRSNSARSATTLIKILPSMPAQFLCSTIFSIVLLYVLGYGRIPSLASVVILCSVGVGAALLLDWGLNGPAKFRLLIVRHLLYWHNVPLLLLLAPAIISTRILCSRFANIGTNIELALDVLSHGWSRRQLALTIALWVICSAVAVATGGAAASELVILMAVFPAAAACARRTESLVRDDPRSDWVLSALITSLIAIAAVVAKINGDTGHAAMAVAMALLLSLYIGQGRLIALTYAVTAVIVFWAYTHSMEIPTSRFEERIAVWAGAKSLIGPDDLFRVREIATSGLPWGWGYGQTPWQGFGAFTGAPLQLQSDYTAPALMAVLGWAGLVIALLVPASFACLGIAQLRKSTGPASRSSIFVLAFSGWGCIAVAVRSLVSIAGSFGLLPLTGVPIAPLSFGPVAAAAALTYAMLAANNSPRTRE